MTKVSIGFSIKQYVFKSIKISKKYLIFSKLHNFFNIQVFSSGLSTIYLSSKTTDVIGFSIVQELNFKSFFLSFEFTAIIYKSLK